MTVMSEKNKTRETEDSVDAFLTSVKDPQRRADCYQLLELFHTISGYQAKMWGAGIIGFGSYHYHYDSGREGDFMRVGFAPRSQYISIYIIPGFSEFESLLAELGSHKMGKSCLNVKRLSDIDLAVLTEIVKRSLAIMAEKYPKTVNHVSRPFSILAGQ